MKVVLRILLINCIFLYAIALDCRDQENNNVDWFIVYKIPQLGHRNDLIRNGVAYIFMTSKDPTWKFSNISINSTDSIIGNTFSPLNNSDVSCIIYNDEPPKGKKSLSKGCTKGIIAANEYGGFWMTHSIPQFPLLGKDYVFPLTGVKYAHTIFCFSMNLPYIDKVGFQLPSYQPNIYAFQFIENIWSRVPKLANILKTHSSKLPLSASPLVLLSKSNKKIVCLTNSEKLKEDLYLDKIASYVKSDLMVQTWANDPEKLQSNCKKKYHVYNIKSINMDVASATFYSYDDQSKWAVSSPNSGKYWICFGDIDRSHLYQSRRGGSMCINNKNIAINFQKLITSVEDCTNRVYSL